MCVVCGDTPTWRYRFADGRTFTSSMAFEYADAQAQAVAKVDDVKIISIERFRDEAWEVVHGPASAKDKE